VRPPNHSRTVGLALGALAVALVLALSGCGKKPKTVDAPEGSGQRPFPQAYPNPNLDPKPGQPSPGVKFP
jgi:hypothetical protein